MSDLENEQDFDCPRCNDGMLQSKTIRRHGVVATGVLKCDSCRYTDDSRAEFDHDETD